MSEGMARKAKRVGAKTQADHSLTFTVAAESWRFRAYVAFWFMCGFAIVISRLVVADILAAGPEDGSTCGPYNRVSRLKKWCLKHNPNFICLTIHHLLY